LLVAVVAVQEQQEVVAQEAIVRMFLAHSLVAVLQQKAH